MKTPVLQEVQRPNRVSARASLGALCGLVLGVAVGICETLLQKVKL